jgi:hypothetical protein
MKKNSAYLFSLFVVACFMMLSAYAQGEWPPNCCSAVEGPNDGSSQIRRSEILISADASQLLGITRTQFVDRLAGTFFPNKQVDLIVPNDRFRRSNTVDFSVTPDGSADGTVIAVQEKRFHRISRNHLREGDLDAVSMLYITDGQVAVRLSFIKGELLALN